MLQKYTDEFEELILVCCCWRQDVPKLYFLLYMDKKVTCNAQIHLYLLDTSRSYMLYNVRFTH